MNESVHFHSKMEASPSSHKMAFAVPRGLKMTFRASSVNLRDSGIKQTLEHNPSSFHREQPLTEKKTLSSEVLYGEQMTRKSFEIQELFC